MKEFFEQQLKDLHLLGIRQVDFLSKEDISKLIAELTRVSESQFGYIPAKNQQAEIRKQLIQDQETGKDGLTVRNLYKWLSKIADPYWKNRITEHEMMPQPEPVTGERRDYWLNVWKETLEKIELSYQEGKGSGSRLKEAMDQLAKKEGFERFPIQHGNETILIKANSLKEAQAIYNETFGPLKEEK